MGDMGHYRGVLLPRTVVLERAIFVRHRRLEICDYPDGHAVGALRYVARPPDGAAKRSRLALWCDADRARGLGS